MNKMTRRVAVRKLDWCFLTVVLIALPGCQKAIAPHSTLPTSVTMHALDSTSTVWVDEMSHITDSLRAVIVTESAWDKMWTRAEGFRGEALKPLVDFTEFYLLVAAAGTVGSGDRARIEAIGVLENTLYALVVSTRSCAPFDTRDTPLHVVRVPRFKGRIVFLESRAGPDSCI